MREAALFRKLIPSNTTVTVFSNPNTQSLYLFRVRGGQNRLNFGDAVHQTVLFFHTQTHYFGALSDWHATRENPRRNIEMKQNLSSKWKVSELRTRWQSIDVDLRLGWQLQCWATTGNRVFGKACFELAHHCINTFVQFPWINGSANHL